MPPASLTLHDGFATIRRPRIGLPRKPPRPPSLASVPENSRVYDPLQDFNGFSTIPRNFRGEQWRRRTDSVSSGSSGGSGGVSPVSPIGNPKIPWWELATSRSKYKSCGYLDDSVSNLVIKWKLALMWSNLFHLSWWCACSQQCGALYLI